MANYSKYLTWEKILQFLITVLTAIATTFGVSSCKAATLHQDPWHEKDPELATPRRNGGCIISPIKTFPASPLLLPGKEGFCETKTFNAWWWTVKR